jgi:3-hydroxy acid dehydrogenase/malonic semialdehyde reductase
VTDVQPGLVGGTEFSVVRNHGDQGKADAVYADTTPLTATDVANVVRWVIALPAHVNINRVEMMPNVQGPGPLTIKRR